VAAVTTSWVLQLALFCTAVVFAVHKTKKEPTDASRLTLALWGLEFRPLSASKKVLLAIVGCVGLLALVGHAALFLG
ncbi:unnamed protein product, partial [Polarella glacialis]